MPIYFPWLGGTDEYCCPPSAEERWIRMQVVLRRLEDDWRERELRLKKKKRKGGGGSIRMRGRAKLGMRLLSLPS
jgi:hypothetical protein